MRLPLPMCPAATVVDPPPAGPQRGGPTVVCGIVENANREAVGRGRGKRRGAGDPTYRLDAAVVAEGLPNQVQAFCCGQGIPGGVAHVGTGVASGEVSSSCSYTACATWRDARDAYLEGIALRNGRLNTAGVERRPERSSLPELQEA